MAVLSACTVAVQPTGVPVAAPVAVSGTAPSVAEAERNFIAAVTAVQPVAEALCRARTAGVPCDFRIVIDDRPGLPPNAFQTLDRSGRPIIGFTEALIYQAQNVDEIAFVMGHEAAHHILGHIPIAQQSATTGALVAGVMASLGGADAAGIRAAQDIGATLGARRYSKDFELEADAMGTEIAWRAGFDPLLGAAFFDRLPDPGDQFLGSHPPNADRRAIVRRVVADLR
jgi:predicted Zn-dependent protease